MGRILLVAQSAGLRAALSQTIRDQAAGTLHVIGAIGVNPTELAEIEVAQPNVIVLVLSFEPMGELGLLQELRRIVPDTRIVIVDTLGDAQLWFGSKVQMIDALLRAEQLATDLVPILWQLVASGDGPGSAGRNP